MRSIYSLQLVLPLIILLTELFVTMGIIFLVIITGNKDSLLLIIPVLVFVFFIVKKIF